VSTTRQHIEDLDRRTWAALTKRAAADAVAAAGRLGRNPPAVVAAVAAMTEDDLVELRDRFGPGPRHLSPVMQLVEADQLRVAAERQARQAEQDKHDAEAAASMARADAEQSARAATAARERARAAQEQAARKDIDHATESAAAQQESDELRGELKRARANAAAAAAAAHQQLSAAQARAEERLAERTAERAAAQHESEELRDELQRVRADAAAEVAAAHEAARAAQARAEERIAERAADRATTQHELEELRGELQRVRADAAAEVAAARGQASGEIAAAQQGAQADVEHIRAEATAQVVAAREQADTEIAAARHAADTEIARVRAEAHDAGPAEAAHDLAPGLLTIPIPPVGLRAHTGPIEEALAAVRDIDYLLDVGVADDAEPPSTLDSERVRDLVGTVQQQAGDLSEQLRDLPLRYGGPGQAEAAGGYARAAADTYGALLQRIATATGQLSQRGHSADADVVAMLTTMLAEHPWRSR
jgi:colicin import membrane protein